MKIAGTCFVKADGEQFTLSGTVTVSPLTKMKEGLSGLSGPAGFKETPRIPWVELEAYTVRGFSLTRLAGLVDATVVVSLANGSVYTFTEAWLAGEPDLNAAEGTVPLRFEALDCVEKTA